jgi:nicotinate-nucleotide adenylyltransferase
MAGLTLTRIGLFGGTFDPPHLGHAILAAEALYSLKLDKVFWILTPQSPLKDVKNISPVDQRLLLLQAALGDTPGFVLSKVDIERKPPYYALDTVRILQSDHPESELIYLMGSDSLNDLPQWYKAADFIHEIGGLGVYHRPGEQPELDSLEKVIPGITQKVYFFDAPQIEISGMDIRERIREHRPYRFFLQPAVYQIIQTRKLYR